MAHARALIDPYNKITGISIYNRAGKRQLWGEGFRSVRSPVLTGGPEGRGWPRAERQLQIAASDLKR